MQATFARYFFSAPYPFHMQKLNQHKALLISHYRSEAIDPNPQGSKYAGITSSLYKQWVKLQWIKSTASVCENKYLPLKYSTENTSKYIYKKVTYDSTTYPFMHCSNQDISYRCTSFGAAVTSTMAEWHKITITKLISAQKSKTGSSFEGRCTDSAA